jgi:hypothetical protein
MKTNLILIGIIILIIAGAYIGSNYYKAKIAELLIEQQANMKLLELKNGIIGRQATEISNQKYLFDKMDENLKEVIKERNQTITDYSLLELKFDSLSLSIPIKDSVVVPEGKYYPVGPYQWGIFSMDGRIWSHYRPERFDFNLKQTDKLSLELAITQTKNGKIKTGFAKPSWAGLKVDSISVDFIPYKTPWYSKLFLDFKVQTSLSNATPFGFYFGMGYDRFGGGILLNNHGRSYLANYRYFPFR